MIRTTPAHRTSRLRRADATQIARVSLECSPLCCYLGDGVPPQTTH